jgi:predicted ATPase with chaperone activity
MISDVGLIGGGEVPSPSEVLRAYDGILLMADSVHKMVRSDHAVWL